MPKMKKVNPLETTFGGEDYYGHIHVTIVQKH